MMGVRLKELFMLPRLHRKLKELINALSNARLLAYCGLTFWGELEYPEETTNLGRSSQVKKAFPRHIPVLPYCL